MANDSSKPPRFDRALSTVGAAVERRLDRSPWTNVYGLGRTLLAIGTLGVLLGSDPRRLLVDHTAAGSARNCSGVSTLSLFCHTSTHDVEWARWLAVVVLLAAVSGLRPRLTCVPHWWITFSVATSVLVEDGGDQLATILTLLLIPVALLDARPSVWSPPRPINETPPLRRLFAVAALTAIRIQVWALYFQAFTAKLAVHEWINGTAVYYYLHNPVAGSPGWVQSIINPILDNPVAVRAVTWGSLVTECLLCLGLFVAYRLRRRLIYSGLLLHLMIAVLMGLPAFSIIMWGALVLYLLDPAAPLPIPTGPHAGRAGARPAWAGRLRTLVTRA